MTDSNAYYWSVNVLSMLPKPILKLLLYIVLSVILFRMKWWSPSERPGWRSCPLRRASLTHYSWGSHLERSGKTAAQKRPETDLIGRILLLTGYANRMWEYSVQVNVIHASYCWKNFDKFVCFILLFTTSAFIFSYFFNVFLYCRIELKARSQGHHGGNPLRPFPLAISILLNKLPNIMYVHP